MALRLARPLARTALALSLLAVTAGPVLAQALAGPGLRSGGSISYDAEGVPTVTAAYDEDAAWLMGYAHARDRFFQMDLLRRTGSGTLAELVGPSVLPQDVEIRTLGLRRAAWATWAKLSPELSGQLKSYADGVNYWLSTNPVPLEHQALELSSADRWTPVDSLVIGKLLAFQLSFDLEIDYTLKLGAYQAAGAAGSFNGTALFFEDTHRVAPPDGRISIPGFLTAQKSEVELPATPATDPRALALAQRYLGRIGDNPVIAPQLKRRENRAGSNWWMVGPTKTASGRPILANDPHLSLDTPMLFHEGHVISTDPRYPQPMNSVGSIAPGTPWPILGCTSDFCWGLTTNSLDVTDTYLEQFVLNTYGLPTHTVHNGVSEPVLWVFQSYFANRIGDGAADNVTRENSIGYTNGGVTVIVPRRNFGPVVDIDGSQGLSIAYTGWGPTFELEAFRKINRARNLDEFRAALANFDVGSQNFGYVDKAGNFAYFVTAEMPIREDLQRNTVTGAPPFLIRNGTGGNDWLPATNRYPGQAVPYEILSPEEMPFTINPARGYIANANNDPVGTSLDNNALNQVRRGGGLLYYAPGHSAYRMGRIDREMQRLVDRGNVTVADMQKLQANNQLMDAELVAPQLVAAFDRAATAGACATQAAASPRVSGAIGYLRTWDYSTPTGIQAGFDAGDNPLALAPPSDTEVRHSVAATLFAMWRGQVIRNTIDHTLTAKGLGSALPGGTEAYSAFKNQIDKFGTQSGRGASGLDFFTKVPSAQAGDSAANRRDCVLLTSLDEAVAALAGNGFSAAFANSTNLADYRWGRLHRIVFDHPLGSQLSIPGNNPYPFTNLATGLPGLARQGGYEAVDASSHNARANSVNGFMFGSGPVRRFIGEMTDTPTLLNIMPGGQDGRIGGPGYISQLPRWLVNAYKPLVIDPAASQAAQVAKIDFVPR
jgi:penicillin amidase